MCAAALLGVLPRAAAAAADGQATVDMAVVAPARLSFAMDVT